MYSSRPAREGETYQTTRFPSGTIGLASAGHPTTAVCLQCDTQLLIEKIPEHVQKKLGVSASEKAIFTRLETGSHRDAVKFSNGREASFQELDPGTEISIVTLLENVNKRSPVSVAA
jgi:hypothetical protein